MSAQAYMPPAAQRLPRNPMLPQHPVSAAYDAQYAADEAVLRANISRSYADILQQLGYSDDQGNFIPGSISTNAARQQTDYQRSSDLAAEGVTQQSQREGTLFSGYRGTETARQQYPFQQQILDLGINVPMQLSSLYEQAAGLTDQYTLQNNQLLAGAAQRAAAAITSSGGGFSGGGGGGGGGGGDGEGTPPVPEGYPNLNPSAPNQVYTPIHVGGTTSYEPKPMASNFEPKPAPQKKPVRSPYYYGGGEF